jgi:hypothetical protein
MDVVLPMCFALLQDVIMLTQGELENLISPASTQLFGLCREDSFKGFWTTEID